MARVQAGWTSGLGPLGLDLGRHTIKAARLAIWGGQLQLEALASRATPVGAFNGQGNLVDGPELRACLAELAAEIGAAGADTVVALATPEIDCRTLEFKAEPGSDLWPATRELMGLDPDGANGSTVTSATLLATPQGTPAAGELADVVVLGVAAPTTLVGTVLGALEGAGLQPLVMEAAPLLAGQVLLNGTEVQPYVVADLGFSHTTWTWWEAGLPRRVVHTEHLASGVEDDLARQVAQLSEGLRAVDPLPVELAGGPAHNVDGEPSIEGPQVGSPQANMPSTSALPRVILHGGRASQPGLAEALAGTTDREVTVADPLANLGLETVAAIPSAVRANAAGWLNALALAWRLGEGD